MLTLLSCLFKGFGTSQTENNRLKEEKKDTSTSEQDTGKVLYREKEKCTKNNFRIN